MFTALVAGTVIAFVLAILPGPVAVSAMKMGISKGIKPAVYLAGGSGFIDFFFSLIAMFATSIVYASASDFTSRHPLLTFFLQIFIVALFVVIGIINLKKKKDREAEIEEAEMSKASLFLANLKDKGPFFVGLGVAAANLANPSFLPSLAYIGMQVHQWHIFDNTSLNNFIFSFGFGLGNFLWLYVLANIVVRLKSRMPENFIWRIRQFAGITFLSFGGILGYRILKITPWSDILRIVFAF